MTISSTQSILWRAINPPGLEVCRLYSRDSDWHLEGTALFLHDHQPCQLTYLIVCDARWNTLSARVGGWLGSATIDIELSVDANHEWHLNGGEHPAVAGCIDLDLTFSPSTNLLPIRRLNLGIGQEAEVRAAWLRFPSFDLETLSQVYRRIDESTFRYESNGGEFVVDLEVNALGFVTNYPGFWHEEL